MAQKNELDSRSINKIEIMNREYRILDQKSVLNPINELMPPQEYIKFHKFVTDLEEDMSAFQNTNINENKKDELKAKIDTMIKRMVTKESQWGNYNVYKDTVRELHWKLEKIKNMLHESDTSNIQPSN